jgi:hypothetical protein
VQGASSYVWTTNIPGAVASGTGTTGLVSFPSGTFSGNVCVAAVTICGPSSTPSCYAVTAGQVTAMGAISGPQIGICGASNVNFQLGTSGASSYSWNVPGATIVNGQGSNSINVNFGTGYTGNLVEVTGTFPCGTDYSSLSITGAPSTPVLAPTSDMVICPNSSGLYIANSTGADTYTWVVSPSGTVFYPLPLPVTGNEIGIQWDASGGNFTVTANNTCGSSSGFYLGSCRVAGDPAMVQALSAQVYPNPAHENLTVEFNSPASEKYVLNVTDFTGRLIISEPINAIEGLNQHQMDMTSIAKGMYLFNLQNQAGQSIVIKVAVE